ncbi:MAG: ATP-binding protein [Bdellovibrionota bacterium]
MFFASRAVFLLLILFSFSGYAAPSEPGDECSGDDFAYEFDPHLEDAEPEDPFISVIRELRRDLQPSQLAFSDWFWGVEGDRKGAKGKYRLLITIQSSLRFFDTAHKTLARAREYGIQLDALHSIKNFLQLSHASLLRMCDIFASDMKLLDRGLSDEQRLALQELRKEVLNERAIDQVSPMMRQVLSGLNEALVVTNRLTSGDQTAHHAIEIETAQMLARLRILYSLSKVEEPKEASAFLGDEDEALEVMANFVSNAQQAGSQLPEISITAQKAYRDFGDKPKDNDRYRCLYSSEQKSGHYVGFSVSDMAGGIPPEVLRRIFVSGVTFSESQGGTGLGLAWVKNVVLGRGGFIEVDTEMGTGSRFTAWFPATEVAKRVNDPAPSIPEGGKEIVVIDDTRGNLQMMVMFLKGRGFNVRGFPSRREALEYLKPNVDRVGVILSDLQTGDDISLEDLLEFTRLHPALTVSICSGNEVLDLPEGVSSAYLKPVHLGEMSETLARQVGKSNQD